ncbi:MAG: PTS IIA-like nitrogen regulatory protein PtsN, partial [Gammaproteobacteria bacterium]|nr:PTS IIA-like nitrogen regulatory protein PtsN [Gammaproteobacteria bacterium]
MVAPAESKRILDILSPARVLCNLDLATKKAILEKLAELIAAGESTLTQEGTFDCLFARERLGSTGLGRGVAIPHGRLEHLQRATGAFVRVRSGIDFDALDQKPVDLLFALVVPQQSTDEHLQILSMLAQMFRDEDFLAHLRAQSTAEGLYEVLTRWSARE